MQTLIAQYAEEYVLTPRDSREQRVFRSRYTGPKNHRGEPDTTGTDEIGVMIYPPNDDTYTGEFLDGAKNGRGVYKHSNGMVREGEFIHDLQVSGTMILPDCTFQGTFLAGMEHTGTFTYTDGRVFTGTLESKTKRVGTVRYPDGDIFSGTFEDWKLNCDDARMIVNSRPAKFTYRGQMRNGVRQGHGTMQIMSGPLMGEHYSARFNMDQEVRKSRVNIPKQGGTRHKRTRCRRKRLRSSKRR